MKAAVVKSDVNVEDVTILEDSLIGNAVADDLVDRCAYRFGEVAIVEGRWVRLRSIS